MIAILQKVKRPKSSVSSRYVDLRFIRPTSNICERLFSVSKFALPNYRKRILPANFEMHGSQSILLQLIVPPSYSIGP